MYKSISQPEAEELRKVIESALRERGLKVDTNMGFDMATIKGSIDSSELPLDYQIKAAIDPDNFQPNTQVIYKIIFTPKSRPDNYKETYFKDSILASDPRFFCQPNRLGEAARAMFEDLHKVGFKFVRTWRPYAELRKS